MTLTLTGYFPPINERAFQSIFCAAFAGVKLEVNTMQFSDQLGPEYYRNCHPLGRSPVLETPDGYVFESGAILRYIARQDKNNSLYGKTAFEASCCDMWIDYAAGELRPQWVSLLRERMFGKVLTEEALREVCDAIDEAIGGIDRWLETRTFLVGERLSVADIAVASSLMSLYRFDPHGDRLTKTFKNAFRLYNTVMQQQPAVEVHKQLGTSFALPKVQKPQKPKAPVQKDEDDEEEEEKPAPESNPLDGLPPTSFALDAFKREYSNKDIRSVVAPYFFSNYDPNGYTCFFARYKHNAENKMTFMTANLVRGWFQRMQHLHKYCFGVALIVGEEKSHEIVSWWIMRGKGMPEAVKQVEDTELFEWDEVSDINTVREAITDFLALSGPTFVQPVLESRVFK